MNHCLIRIDDEFVSGTPPTLALFLFLCTMCSNFRSFCLIFFVRMLLLTNPFNWAISKVQSFVKKISMEDLRELLKETENSRCDETHVNGEDLVKQGYTKVDVNSTIVWNAKIEIDLSNEEQLLIKEWDVFHFDVNSSHIEDRKSFFSLNIEGEEPSFTVENIDDDSGRFIVRYTVTEDMIDFLKKSDQALTAKLSFKATRKSIMSRTTSKATDLSPYIQFSLFRKKD